MVMIVFKTILAGLAVSDVSKYIMSGHVLESNLLSEYMLFLFNFILDPFQLVYPWWRGERDYLKMNRVEIGLEISVN